MMSSTSTASSTNLVPTTKLRLLPCRETNIIINILNRNNCWKDLAAVITHPDHPEELLFSADNISTLELQWKNDSSPAEALLQHWKTYGKEQPNLIDLVRFLRKANLLRAATEIETNLMKDYSGEYLHSEDLNANNNEDEISEVDIIAEALADVDLCELTLFSYRDLQIVTDDFCDRLFEEGGCKIGEGAFGCVYRAEISNVSVAVKKLKDPVDRQFITELNVLTKFKHENLLPLLGCSFNGPNCCLVYEFMSNGSLQERLACIGDSPPIPWSTRCSVAYSSALGINHLHTYGEMPMVHRDIKSANILLDGNFIPKVGDFGLVRMGSSNTSTTTAVTKNVYGTCIYMAPEAFWGDVSIKLDSFSFGVVLLELLTGLPPLVSREDGDLVTYIETCDNVTSVYDTKIDWCSDAATEIYKIAKLCLAKSKRDRPAISQILEDLKKCFSFADAHTDASI